MEKIKRVAMCGLLVFAVFLWLLLSAGEINAQVRCSDTTLSGCFGITWTGDCVTCDLVGPRAGVGQITFNGQGGLSGSVTKSKDGNIGQATATGTYTVNPDCTGSATITDSDGEARNFSFVIVETFIVGAIEVFGIQTDSGRVITLDLKRCL